MESADLHATNTKLPESIAKFARSSSGKRYGQSLSRVMDSACYCVCDSVGNCSSLASAGTSENNYWA
jgi:hypothetical protein